MTSSARFPAPDNPGSDQEPWSLASRLLHDRSTRTPYAETTEAVFMTSAYVYASAEAGEAATKADGDDLVYSRFRNPSVLAFERRMKLIEGAPAAQATASGMAAVTASMLCCVRPGHRVVAPRVMFGACNWLLVHLLPQLGVEVVRVDGSDLDGWTAALSRPTKLVFFETPGNPTMELVDIAAVSELAHRAGAIVVADNALASPLVQSPLRFGADIVVYSATKHVDGQGRCLGGIVLGPTEFIRDTLTPFVRNTGPTLSPFNAWLLSKGLETLDLRVRASAATALTVAQALDGHSKLARVLYPGLESHPQHALARRQMRNGGTVMAFDFADGKPAAFRFLNTLKLILRVNNLGDVRSLATHAATTTHARLTEEERRLAGIGDGLVRLSVGLEPAEDLLTDLTRALAAA